jgi:O-antigen ligase
MLLKQLQNYSLSVFVFLLHFEYWNILPGASGAFTLTKLAGYTYFIFSIINFKDSFRVGKLKLVLTFLWLLYFLLLIRSAYNYFLYPSITSVLNLSILQCIILFWIAANHLLVRKELIPYILKIYIFGALLVSILASFGIGTTLTWDRRILMFGEDPNYVGYRITFAIIIIVAILLDKRLRRNNYEYWWAAAIPLLLNALAHTGSRGAVLCLFFSILVYALILKTHWFIKPVIILIFLTFMYVMFQYMDQNPVFHKRFIMTVQGGDTGHRTMIWQKLIRLFYVNPLFGIGETGYNQSTKEIFGYIKGSHNVFLELLIKTGIMGLLFFLGFIYNMAKRSFYSWRKGNQLLPVILCFAVIILFTNIQGLYNKTIYVIFALIFSMSSGYRRIGTSLSMK